MATLEQNLNGYIYGIETFEYGDGEAHLLNSTRRYLGSMLHLMTTAQQDRLFAADRFVGQAAHQAEPGDSWEQVMMRDLDEYLAQERILRQAA